MKNTRVAILLGSDKEMPTMRSWTDAADARCRPASILLLPDPSTIDRFAEYRESWNA